jgi:hypothetical protein
VLADVRAAVENWPEFARQAGVADKTVRDILPNLSWL